MSSMDLSNLKEKTLQVSRGLTYTYYTSPAKNSKPTLALFHGFPDTAKLWAGLINNYLLPHGYGILALDCLGYGKSSKPADTKAYGYNLMTADIAEILDAENLAQVISFGHDHGSGLAQKFYQFCPSRVSGLVMINIPYAPATGEFNVDAVNKVTRKLYGLGIFEYWHFFAAEDCAALMNQNLESVYSLSFGDPESWPGVFCVPGGVRKWVTEGRTQPTLPYATAEHKADFMERFSQGLGLEPPLRWYKAMVFNIQNEVEKLLPPERNVVRVPALFWGGEQDYVCRSEGLQPHIEAGLLPDLKIVTRPGGHWALLEKPDDFGQDVLAWLKETF